MFRFLQRMLGRGTPETHTRLARLSERWRTRPELESLGTRVLPSVSPVFLAGNQLNIRGSTQADTVQVSTDGNQVNVTFNGTQHTFDAALVRRLHVILRGGDDHFENATSLPCLARGGAGNDTLIGGTGRDTLLGDEGADDLRGNAGNDRLHGGNGRDHMRGGTGQDRLRGGADDDELDGGLGSDDLRGGGGSDTSDRDNDDDFDDCESDEVDATEIELVAELTGAGGATGEVEFETDGTEVELEIEIDSATPNTTYDVFIDGVLVGTLITDSDGEGELNFSDPTFLGNVAEGSVVSIRDSEGNTLLEGTLTRENDDDDDEDDA